MKQEQVLQVIATYRTKLDEMGVRKSDHPHEIALESPASALAHCSGMLDKMEGFVREGRIEKAFRWLGFLQGVLWSQKVYTLSELTAHNRSDKE